VKPVSHLTKCGFLTLGDMLYLSLFLVEFSKRSENKKVDEKNNR